MNLALFTDFLMYMTVANIFLYIVIMVLIRNYSKTFVRFHLRLLKLKDTQKNELKALSFRVMRRYVRYILIFNLVPLLALHLMA